MAKLDSGQFEKSVGFGRWIKCLKSIIIFDFD